MCNDLLMDPWHKEIVELHEHFEAYFLGTIDSLDRVDAALAPTFTMAGPDGSVADRDQVMAALKAGHAHTQSLTISITDAELLAESGDLVVATYIEGHALASGSNHRRTTVVFQRADSAPNGLQWTRAQETWVDRS